MLSKWWIGEPLWSGLGPLTARLRLSLTLTLRRRTSPILGARTLDALFDELGEEFVTLLQQFGENLPGRVRILESALAQGDARGAEVLAHGLRGSSRWYGAGEMARVCDVLERQVRLDKLEHARWLLAPLVSEAERVRDELRRLVASPELRPAWPLGLARSSSGRELQT